MRAGSLRQTIELQRQELVEDEDSRDVGREWKTYKKMRAEVKSPSITTETEIANHLTGITRYTINTRYVDCARTDRIKWKGRILQVGTIEQDPKGFWTRIYASEENG